MYQIKRVHLTFQMAAENTYLMDSNVPIRPYAVSLSSSSSIIWNCAVFFLFFLLPLFTDLAFYKKNFFFFLRAHHLHSRSIHGITPRIPPRCTRSRYWLYSLRPLPLITNGLGSGDRVLDARVLRRKWPRKDLSGMGEKEK